MPRQTHILQMGLSILLTSGSFPSLAIVLHPSDTMYIHNPRVHFMSVIRSFGKYFGAILSLCLFIAFFEFEALAELHVFGKLPAEVERLLCRRFLTPQTITNATLSNRAVSYSAIEIGDYSFKVELDPLTGMRRVNSGYYVSGGKRIIHDRSKVDLYFMPDALDNQPAYFAETEVDPTSGRTQILLHSLSNRKVLGKIIDKQLKLVWSVYKAEKTVTEKEISEFKRQEKLLDPQRKITFSIFDSETDEILSVMRVYDGSPFPGRYLVDFGVHFDYGEDTDPRIPVERRYQQLDFRKDTKYVFEAGRLAKDARITGALEKEFKAFADHLFAKYGYDHIVPSDFLRGRIYIEITKRNLKTFLKPRNEDGFGFKLFYKPKKELEQPQKYILYTTVEDFIRNFHGPVNLSSRNGFTRIIDIKPKPRRSQSRRR